MNIKADIIMIKKEIKKLLVGDLGVNQSNIIIN
jgi:hypothetical protein